jgi:hypothetical protein
MKKAEYDNEMRRWREPMAERSVIQGEKNRYGGYLGVSVIDREEVSVI